MTARTSSAATAVVLLGVVANTLFGPVPDTRTRPGWVTVVSSTRPGDSTVVRLPGGGSATLNVIT